MCNLNILIRKNTRKKSLIKVIPSFLMGVTSNSYAVNSDGDGFYAGGVIERNVNKIDLLKYKPVLMDSKIILTHQRISTSGLSSRYTQPFINKDFALIHNGIINEFLGKNGSDTYGFFKQFCKQFYLKNEMGFNREEKIKYAIKDLLDGLDCGSFSIAILDRVTNNLYYFKNDDTSIYAYSNSELLYFTTLEENKLFLSMFKIRFWEREVKDYRIYRINTDDEIKIKIIGRIKKASNSYGGYNKKCKRKQKNSYNGGGGYSGYCNGYQSNIKFTGHETKLKGRCANCDRKTRNWSLDNSCWLCLDCEKYYKDFEDGQKGDLRDDKYYDLKDGKYYDLKDFGGEGV